MTEAKDPIEPTVEFDFKLTTPISYSSGQDQITASFIKLTAPSARNSRECSKLKQAFFRAIPDSKSDEQTEKGKKDPEIDGFAIVTMMAMSSDVELDEVMETARKLFISGNGIAMVDGETKLTNHLVDKMSQDDLEAMMGQYLANFTLASALAKMKEI